MAYRIGHDGETFSEPLRLVEVLRRVRAHGVKAGPAHWVRYPGKPRSPDRTLPVLLSSLAWHLPRLSPGEAVRLAHGTQTERKDYTIRVVVDASPEPKPAPPLLMYTGTPVDLTQGNDRISAIGGIATLLQPRVRCSGFVFTRPVNPPASWKPGDPLPPGSSWSQHSRFATGGNAIDLSVYKGDDYHNGNDMDTLLDLAAAYVALFRAGKYDCYRLIVANTQYRADTGFKQTPYTGTFHTHIHMEGDPLQTGTPV